MGFFLVGRRRDDARLRLITDELFPERQAALQALSQLSSQPEFDSRDDEVFVVDLDSAVPVLVVAPAAPQVEEETPVDTISDESDVSEDSPEDAPEDSFESVLPPAEPVVAEESDEGSAGVWEAPSDAESPDGAELEEPADLADALKRAADSMESEGVVAIESVGPEPATPSAPDAAWPWEPADAEIDPAEEVAEETFVLQDIEEPSVDEGSLLGEVEADESFDAPKPVIMGDYADDVSTPDEPVMPIEEPVGVVDESQAAEDVVSDDQMQATDVPIDAAEAIDDPDDVAFAEAASIDPNIEDMLADLEPAVEVVPAIEESTPGNDGPEPDTAALTCDDCVYVSTCPNKDELEPASCGNFQWKSV